MNHDALRRAVIESGITLVACSLVLLGVALLASASLRSLQDSISLVHSTHDRRIAQHAADAALHDAALMLTMIPDQLTVDNAQGAHRIGEITGAIFSHGGRLQSCELPSYVVEALSRTDSIDAASTESPVLELYRVTARGKGYSGSTTVVLQADFVLQICRAGISEAQHTVQDAEQVTEQNKEIKRAECISSVRRLAWRVLQTT